MLVGLARAAFIRLPVRGACCSTVSRVRSGRA